MTPEEIAAQEAEESAAFESEMFNAPAEKSTEAAPETVVTATPEKEPEIEKEPEEVRVFGMTETEFKASLSQIGEVATLRDELAKVNKVNSKLAGQIGEFKQRLEKIQTSKKGPQFKLNAVADLKDQFPELASALFGDDEAVAEDPKPEEPKQEEEKQKPVDEAKPEEDEVDLTTKLERKFEEKLVKLKHPDFETIRNSKEFGQWLGSLPAAEYYKVKDSWDSAVVIPLVDRFKEATAKPAEKIKDSATASRRTAAVQPKGVHRPASQTLSPEDEEDKAFQAEMYG